MLDFKEKKYFLILFPIIFQLFLFITSNRVEKIFLIFRMDDYSTDSNSEIESKIFEIFSKDSLPIIVGITPFSYDDINNLIPLGYKKKELIFKYLDQKNKLYLKYRNEIEFIAHYIFLRLCDTKLKFIIDTLKNDFKGFL